MFYLILTILLVVFYIFVAPRHIKGTINLLTAVFALVVLVSLLLLAFFKILQFSSEMWVGLGVILVGLWAMRDIYSLDKGKKNKARPRRDKNHPHRRYKTLQ